VPIETIYGQLQGLKASQLKRLQSLYHQRLPGDLITTVEFAQRLAAISTEIDQPLCAYINRRGQVMRVGVGTPRQTQIPPLELPRYGNGRLSGIRCITTQTSPEPPKEAALTAMAIQRLDILVVLTLTGGGFQRRGGGETGYIKDTYMAHLVPEMDTTKNQQIDNGFSAIPYYLSLPMSLDALSQQDFLDLVNELETEFEREFVAREVDSSQDKVLLVGVKTDKISPQRFEDGLTELVRLVDTD
jgi:GTP-binding protein HflX